MLLAVDDQLRVGSHQRRPLSGHIAQSAETGRQCAKLKCCLNFEVDAYVEASKRMPPRDIRLETADATYFHFKSDIFSRLVTYSTDKTIAANLRTISADRAFEIISLNKSRRKTADPGARKRNRQRPNPRADFGDILGGEDDISRFDKRRKNAATTERKI